MWCITTVLTINKATVSKSQNVKDSSDKNKYLRIIEINIWTKKIQLIRMQTSYVTAPPGELSWTNATLFAKLLIEVKKLTKNDILS